MNLNPGGNTDVCMVVFSGFVETWGEIFINGLVIEAYPLTVQLTD